MTEQEKINGEIQMKLALQDAKFNVFMKEMNERDNQRAADMREIRGSIDSTNKHVRNLTITAMIGIGAMVITSVIGIAAMVWSVIPK